VLIHDFTRALFAIPGVASFQHLSFGPARETTKTQNAGIVSFPENWFAFPSRSAAGQKDTIRIQERH